MSAPMHRIALIGFGEAGRILGAGWVATGRYAVAAWDVLLDAPDRAGAMRERIAGAGARACTSFADAVADAELVVSAVTATSAESVARDGGASMRAGQLFVDLNSVSPVTKRRNAAHVERSGAAYVEGAVMAPVPPSGLRVPIVLGGARAADVRRLLEPAGMNLEVGAPEIGRASATKMCRSIMIKGLEALVVECLQTARLYGVEREVLASMKRTYPGVDWDTQAGYLLGRVLEHGRRRAAEMREVAGTVRETGLEPSMASAIADRQQWVADLVQAHPGLSSAKDADWPRTFDAMAEAAGLRGLAGDDVEPRR